MKYLLLSLLFCLCSCEPTKSPEKSAEKAEKEIPDSNVEWVEKTGFSAYSGRTNYLWVIKYKGKEYLLNTAGGICPVE